MKKRYCEARGKRFKTAEAYQTGNICDGCAAEFNGQLCADLDDCGSFRDEPGIIWVECKADKTEGEA